MIVPTGNRVLVKPDPVETTTKGGIVLAIDSKHEQAAAVTGTVVSHGDIAFKEFVGDAFKTIYEPFARVGDKVQYRRYTGVAVKDPESGEEYLLINDSDILSRFEQGQDNV